MTFREEYEQREREFLSPFATLSANTKGRERKETECEMRTPFQRDRDRIIHSKEFRRIMHKTQVFIAPEGDHYRTRLTHTLEVSQIGRTIARALRLNEDLVEGIALGHDLGHTPFGHSGERTLNRIMKNNGGFKHNKQSLRVCEKIAKGGKGLNLTFEVRDGIVNHAGGDIAATLEGKIIKYADRIAYINHDIDDAIRSKVLSQEDLPKEEIAILGQTHSARINTLIKSIVNNSIGRNHVLMEESVEEAMLSLRKFLFQKVYSDKKLKEVEEKKADKIITILFEHFLDNSDLMPEEYGMIVDNDGVERAICDFIAGMTDRYAISTFKKICIPSAINE